MNTDERNRRSWSCPYNWHHPHSTCYIERRKSKGEGRAAAILTFLVFFRGVGGARGRGRKFLRMGRDSVSLGYLNLNSWVSLNLILRSKYNLLTI